MKYKCNLCGYQRRMVKHPKFHGVDEKASPNSIQFEFDETPRCPHCQIELWTPSEFSDLRWKQKQDVKQPSIPYTPKRKIN